MRGKNTSRQKILAAAGELAHDTGLKHFSLDAVASRAGVSKGGLLYNFPTKAKLLEALVEQHLEEFRSALDEREKQHESAPGSVAAAYLELSVCEYDQSMPPPSGVLAAMAEDPSFLNPIRRFKRELLDRMLANANDETLALTIFLVMEGLRSMKLFDHEILTSEQRHAVIDALLEALAKKSDHVFVQENSSTTTAR